MLTIFQIPPLFLLWITVLCFMSCINLKCNPPFWTHWRAYQLYHMMWARTSVSFLPSGFPLPHLVLSFLLPLSPGQATVFQGRYVGELPCFQLLLWNEPQQCASYFCCRCLPLIICTLSPILPVISHWLFHKTVAIWTGIYWAHFQSQKRWGFHWQFTSSQSRHCKGSNRVTEVKTLPASIPFCDY